MAWESRIIGHGEAAPSDLVGNPRNWRTHPQAQRDALAGVLDEVGWVQDVIVNKRTGYLVDGHARVAVAAQRGEDAVPVVYVDLSEDEEYLILSTLAPLSAMAESDTDALSDLLEMVETSDGAIAQMLSDLATESGIEAELDGVAYTQKIETPIYEPTGEQPSVSELYDTSVTDLLLTDIDAADLPKDLKSFLVVAAKRHTVLRFDKIANYYAHADSNLQRLMEASALVVVDSDQAVERGFLKLHESMLDALDSEYPDA